MKQNDKDMSWSMYLSYMANPIAQPMSFNDFTDKLNGGNQKKKVKKDAGMSDAQIQKQVHQAEGILKGFKPPQKGGDG